MPAHKTTTAASAITKEQRTKLDAARLLIIAHPHHGRPYYAQALMALSPPIAITRDPDFKTLGVDARWRLYVYPDFIDQLSVAELAVGLIHEVNHLLRDHHVRAESIGVVDAERIAWNLASDAEINQDLRSDGMELPLWAALPRGLHQPDRLTAEEYFERLRTPAGSDGDAAPHYDQAGPGVGEAGPGDCGSCSGGSRRSHELSLGGPGSESDEPGLDSSHADALRRRVAADTAAHITANGRGSVPEGLRRWAEALLEPKVDWRRELASLVRTAIASVAGKIDYTYRYPSRRSTDRVLFPALRAPMHRICVVLDTSGSMGGEDLAAALTEVEGILRSVGCDGNTLTVLTVDAAVHTVQRVTTASRIDVLGGGGTDMRVGIAAAEELRPRPTIIIVLTDGLTPWPAAPTACPVLAGVLASTGEMPGPAPVPPWIKTVLIDVDT